MDNVRFGVTHSRRGLTNRWTRVADLVGIKWRADRGDLVRLVVRYFNFETIKKTEKETEKVSGTLKKLLTPFHFEKR